MARSFTDYLTRKRQQFGDRFDSSDLNPLFVRFFESGERIEVSHPVYGTRTGTIGVTTGWKPAFLLMHRSNSLGSSDLLGKDDKPTMVKRGRMYVRLP